MPSGAAAGTKKKAFRGDIQGLRAVAVLTVFADHLFGWPSGGFIGVDVFFVISGFLITGILLREFEKTGHISFKGFYVRRVRRILPASLVTLAVTVGLSFLLFPGTKATGVLWDGIASFFFVGNWRFAATGTDYFAQGATSPLQHFWSLGVEEQFYFVWPWVMLGILLIGTRIAKRSTEAAVRVAGLLMIAVVIASFVFALAQSASAPTVAYFSTLTRTWELGIGAALAIFGSVFTNLPMIARIVMAWGGLAVIGAGLFLISPASTFPAPWAAIPVVGAALVIAAGIGQEPHGNVLLANPVSRYIGDISYSLYLWHFPVIILGAALFPEQGLLYYLGASVVGIILAVLSYELIERPMMSSPLLTSFRSPHDRRTAWTRWSRDQADRVRLITAAVLVPTVVGVMALIFIFPPSDLSAEQIEQINEANKTSGSGETTKADYTPTGELNSGIYTSLSAISWPDPLNPTRDTVATEGMPEEDQLRCSALDVTTCTFGPNDASEILVYGDSLGTTLLPTVRAAYESDRRVRGLTLAACAVTDLEVEWASDQQRDWCLEHRSRVRQLVESDKPKTVLVIQNYAWSKKLTSKATGDAAVAEWAAADKKLADDLTAAGAERVVFISSPPEGKSIIDCATANSSPKSCTSTVPGYWDTIQAAQTGSGLPFLDELDWFCADGECPVINGSTVVRRDFVHPTRQYAQAMGPEFRQRLDELAAP